MTGAETGNLDTRNLDAKPDEHPVPSFSKALFAGEIHSEMVMPFPVMAEDERKRSIDLVTQAREFLDVHYDPDKVEADRWVPDDILRGLGEIGALGLYVAPEYGGQGLSQTGYCRVMEEIGVTDATLAVVLGVHSSIGMKPIHLFGTEDQKARWLPDLAAGRKLAAFALTEPNAGSDAYHLESWAERQADGSFVLNGMKHYIGNGSRADVICTFARCDGGHVALVVEKGMDGFEVGERHATFGLAGNDLRRLYFNDVRVPAENVLGEAGDGFRVAMHTLNNGRMSLGTGVVGAAKQLIDICIEHVSERHQFGIPLGEFELVEEKIAWMVSYLYGLEAMTYLATGLVDAGVEDYSLESAMGKVAGTEFIWYAANRAFQLCGGSAYVDGHPLQKVLRDIRIFPIFEGANDVLRAYIALLGLKEVAGELEDLRHINLSDPIGTIGVLASYVAGRARRQIAPDRLQGVHDVLQPLADPVSEQVTRLRGATENMLRKYGEDVKLRQFQQKRLADNAIDIVAQVATLSRTTGIFADIGPEAAGQERFIAETFCRRAANRVHQRFAQMEDNDDERMHSIARLAYKREGYGLTLF